MEEVGLIALTHILNGGVRIQYNPSLCYARNADIGDDNMGTINWRSILKDDYYAHDQNSKTYRLKKEYLMIEVE